MTTTEGFPPLLKRSPGKNRLATRNPGRRDTPVTTHADGTAKARRSGVSNTVPSREWELQISSTTRSQRIVVGVIRDPQSGPRRETEKGADASHRADIETEPTTAGLLPKPGTSRPGRAVSAPSASG